MSEESKPLPWEVAPDKYQRDADGNFILKKDGTPKRRPGARGYHLHSDTSARIDARRSLSKHKRDAKKLEQKLATKRRIVKQKAEIAKKLDGKTLKPHIVSETDLDFLPMSAKEELLDNSELLAFKPHPGPQTDFLAASEKEVLYGGAAGGGKSYAMLADPLRYVHLRDHRALLLRRHLSELDDLIDISREMYPKAYPGCTYKEAKKWWIFPSGAKIQFNYLEKDSDVYQYQGKAFTWIGFDELTHLPTSFAWDYLRSRLRSTNPDIVLAMRATTNPGGVGHDWVKERFITPSPPNRTFWDASGKVSRRFIPAKLSDNPSLAATGEYESLLMSLDPVTRARLLDGDWDINEGAAFPEFNRSIHVIAPMLIPSHWEKFKAIDYGYRAPSCCLWFAVDPTDGTLICYRELYEKGLTGYQLGMKIADMEADEYISIPGILDGAAWNQTGNSGPTVGEEMQSRQGGGHKLRRADKNRIAGKIQIHERLRVDPNTGRPKAQFTANCTNIIKQLSSIPVDPNNKEDVDTNAEDHAYDACRYGMMSRPRVDNPLMRMLKFKQQRFTAFDNTFGY
jgi:hypothetical protein